MGKIHPGAVLFSEEARKAVAEGPLFDRFVPTVFKNSDHCCVLGALLLAELPGRRINTDATPDAVWAAEVLEYYGYPVTNGTRRWLGRLVKQNDRGEYADRANLRRDLLGEEGTK